MFFLRFMVVILLISVAQPASARRSACDRLKPEQRLTEEKMNIIDGALHGGKYTMGASVELSSQAGSSVNMQLLSSDNLARSWFIYQACVLKEAGMVSEEMMDDMMRSLFGLGGPTSDAKATQPTSTAPAAAATSPQTPLTEFEVNWRSCNDGDMVACYKVGYAYDAGMGVKADSAFALDYFKRSCDGGHLSACADAGDILVLLYENNAELQEGVGYLNKGCNGSDSASCFLLGEAYYFGDIGDGADEDLSRAVSLYQKGCELGSTDACLEVAYHYIDPEIETMTPDPNRAYAIYKRLCDSGAPEGCTSLGVEKYLHGDQVDSGKALTLIKKGCDGDDSEGCYSLAQMYRDWDLHKSSGLSQRDRVKIGPILVKLCEGPDVYYGNKACGWLITIIEESSPIEFGLRADSSHKEKYKQRACAKQPNDYPCQPLPVLPVQLPPLPK